ncbi:hypothetical protein DFJ74DRAFT_774246 [Hyaloraphidium curvatum]|nr:hypothetical protein DFJ74DRAFT_774246 [Hyaloraphidium curvatum]
MSVSPATASAPPPPAANRFVDADGLEWAPVPVIDLSRVTAGAASPAEERAISKQLVDAARTEGFFVVTGHGVPREEVREMYRLNEEWAAMPRDEKLRFKANPAENYWGYVPNGMKQGWRGRSEMYNWPPFSAAHAGDAHLWKDRADRARFLEGFSRRAHELGNRILELRHRYDRANRCMMRLMRYHKLKDYGDEIPGHTDFNSLTMLFSPSIAALQVLCRDNRWRFVKPLEDAVICNRFWTDGYLKSTQHRVVSARFEHERDIERPNVIYFLYANDDVPLLPLPSPYVPKKPPKEGKVLTAGEWDRLRVAHSFSQTATDHGASPFQDAIDGAAGQSGRVRAAL